VGSSFAERTLAAVDPARLSRYAPRAVGAEAGPRLELCRDALAHPLGAPLLGELTRAARRIAIAISDASRDEPRDELLTALLEQLPRERVTLVVAAGTHRADAGVVPTRFRDLPCVVHDATRADRFVELGTTREGTTVRMLREICEADLVVATGRIRPHYFAGYSGGVKSVFPGCGFQADILENHLLKADPSARLGRVDDNRCRLDMEEAALMLPGRLSILDVLDDCDGNPVAAASGDPILAHRALARQARELFVVEAPRSAVVVVADRPPVTRSLYQASKMLPPAGALLEPGGTVIMLAECDQGIGPLERVNEGIYRLGVSRQLPEGHRVVLVSRLSPDVVRESYAEPAGDFGAALEEALDRAGVASAVLLWRAGECIAEASPGGGREAGNALVSGR
jgi:nickel-dependent lactate racemase